MRILLIEDELYIAKAVAEILKKHNYTVDLAHDGEYGLDCALSDIYDILIIDIMLPKMNGLDVLKEIRQAGLEIPILMFSARSQVEDKVAGLDMGADDYLPKPFHSEELLARLRALGRRKVALHEDGLLSFEDIQLAPHALIAYCGKTEIKLTLKEAQLLEMLINNPSVAISKEQMIEKVWGYDAEVIDNHVEAQISLLRKKLSTLKSKIAIKTIRGVGYTLVKGDQK